MKLADWLETEKRERKLTRAEFAKRVGVSASTITMICAGAWTSKDVMEAIFRETNGAVTPNDLAGFNPLPTPQPEVA